MTSATAVLLLSLALLLSGHLVYCCFYNEFKQKKSFVFSRSSKIFARMASAVEKNYRAAPMPYFGM